MTTKVKVLGVIATVCLMFVIGISGLSGSPELSYRLHGLAYRVLGSEGDIHFLISNLPLGYLACGAILYIERRSRGLMTWGFLLAMTVLGFLFCLGETLSYFGTSMPFPFIHWPLATVVLLWIFLLISSHLHPDTRK